MSRMKIGNSPFGNSKNKRPEPLKAASAVAQRSTPWHAVSIIAKNESCIAARALKNAKFLSAQAPRLPLADCTMGGACPCGYKHHSDRRGSPRRKDEITGLKQGGRLEQERRITRSRRETD
jgi:hypothetical protein